MGTSECTLTPSPPPPGWHWRGPHDTPEKGGPGPQRGSSGALAGLAGAQTGHPRRARGDRRGGVSAPAESTSQSRGGGEGLGSHILYGHLIPRAG
eukprot:scaffold121_cov412-Prasinococcus_capsulatus_cf.AAC.10